MKTAISLPDETFDAATRRAAELGISRSHFFALAARRYLDELDQASESARIDDALSDVDPDTSSADAVAAGLTRLSGDDGW